MAWITSGRSSRRAISCGWARLRTYGSSRISASARPRSCSRITYVASRSSSEERVERNENGLLKKSESLPMGRDANGARVTAVRKPSAARFAEREVHGVDDRGEVERIVIWIERLPGATWAVGRAVNPQHRPSDEPRADDYIFQGFELSDALLAANEALEDDAVVSEQ